MKKKYTIVYLKYIGNNQYVIEQKRVNCKEKEFEKWLSRLNPDKVYEGWPKQLL